MNMQELDEELDGVYQNLLEDDDSGCTSCGNYPEHDSDCENGMNGSEEGWEIE